MGPQPCDYIILCKTLSHLTGAAESPCILDEGIGPWDEVEVRLPAANKKLGVLGHIAAGK